MNSCILLVKVLQNPELRYTQDSQTPVAELAVEFEGDREGDAPSSLKVVGWGNLATEIQQTYHEGDRLVVEGRLSIRNIDRPDGIKEKKAELVASRIYALGDAGIVSASPRPSERAPEPSTERTSERSAAPVNKPAASPDPISGGNEINYDDIPF